MIRLVSIFLALSLPLTLHAADRCTSKAVVTEDETWIYEIYDSKTGFTQSIIGLHHGDDQARTRAAALISYDIPSHQKAEVLNLMSKDTQAQRGIKSRQRAYAYLADKAKDLAWIGVEGGPNQVSRYEAASGEDLKITEFVNKRWSKDKPARDRIRAMALFPFSYPYALKSARYPKMDVFGLEADTHDRIYAAMDNLPNQTSTEAIAKKLRFATEFPEMGITEEAVKDLAAIAGRYETGEQTPSDEKRYGDIIKGIKNDEVMFLAQAYFQMNKGEDLKSTMAFMAITAGHGMREAEMAESMSKRKGNGAAIIGVGHAQRLNERLLAKCNGGAVSAPEDQMQVMIHAFTNTHFTMKPATAPVPADEEASDASSAR